ncbi:PIG-L deacetylase family protein [Helicovermis profundi]|uniref:PIG-L family deacetylase n=1 Tax=Helicovermis profundi TaxID=3065157 RepID=A0AAU9E866_9FIRM|nr:PIG-L family deacetylase [Clostridia bacterium S502]
MNKTAVVITPHPDDETLGCGGTLLVLKNIGYKINWLIVTNIFEEFGFSKEKIESRNNEIDLVSKRYGFDIVKKIGIPTSRVDEISKGKLVSEISNAFNEIKPNIIFAPFYNDVHTDHKAIAEATLSCTKWFRYSYIEKVLYYETISETDFNIDSTAKRFNPNVYIDISQYLDEKLSIMKIYESEIGEFPFPRSEKAIRSLAYLRGSQCGSDAAEAFELLRANIKL